MRSVGLEQVRTEAKGPEATKQFASQLTKLMPAGEIGLLSALASRGDAIAKPEVLATENKHGRFRTSCRYRSFGFEAGIGFHAANNSHGHRSRFEGATCSHDRAGRNGQLGKALSAAEAAMNSDNRTRHDAGLQAFCKWPDASIADKLAGLIEKTTNASERSLAFKAFVRIVSLRNDKRSDQERLNRLKQGK